VLIERKEIAGEASGLNAGTTWANGWGKTPDLESTLGMGSLEIFQTLQLDLGLNVEFRQNGSLKLIQTEAEYIYCQQKVRELATAGYRVELLDSRTVRSVEPQLAPDVLGALHSAYGSNANPVLATQALAKLARQHGAELLQHHEVTELQCLESGAYRVMTVLPGDDEQLGSLQAGTLVLAAGAWCRELGARLGLTIPVFAVRGQMWATEPLPPRIFHNIGAVESELAWHNNPYSDPNTPRELTHRDGQRVTRHLYGRQIYSGEIIIGGDRQINVERLPDPAGIAVNHQHASELFPFLHQYPIKRTWSGWMPFTRDLRPIVGQLPHFEHLYILTGLSSSGFEQGPMAGKLLAEYIHSGVPSPLLAEADPAIQVL
jgi:glycine/D-amino acid oxidase-like deaminating enzyme